MGARLVLSRAEPEVGPDRATAAEAARVLQREHVGERGEQAYAAGLAQPLGLGVPRGRDPFEGALQGPDLLGEPRDERREMSARSGPSAGWSAAGRTAAARGANAGAELAGSRAPQAFTAPRT